MAIAVVLFILLSWNYKYVEDVPTKDDGEKKCPLETVTSTPMQSRKSSTTLSSSSSSSEGGSDKQKDE
jgi:hypothetical protein